MQNYCYTKIISGRKRYKKCSCFWVRYNFQRRSQRYLIKHFEKMSTVPSTSTQGENRMICTTSSPHGLNYLMWDFKPFEIFIIYNLKQGSSVKVRGLLLYSIKCNLSYSCQVENGLYSDSLIQLRPRDNSFKLIY